MRGPDPINETPLRRPRNGRRRYQRRPPLSHRLESASAASTRRGTGRCGIGEAFGSNSGWAINPARDFGPRLFEWIAGWSTAWETRTGAVYFWVPTIGPLIGGAIGAGVYDFFVGRFLPIGDEETGDAQPQDPDVERAHA